MQFLIALMTSDSNILAQVLYWDQSRVLLIGDVICPNKKCEGKKCVCLMSFEKFNKSTYQCKLCKACSRLLNSPFMDQRPCVTLFGWTYCFRKKTRSDYQKEKLSPLMRQYIPQSKLSTTKTDEANINLVQKKQRYYLLWNNRNNRVTLLLSVFCNINLLFSSIFKIFSNWQHSPWQSTQYNIQSPTTEHSAFWTLVLIQ